MRSSRSLDTVTVMFDDDNLVANAGLILPATLVQHLDLEARSSRSGPIPARSSPLGCAKDPRTPPAA